MTRYEQWTPSDIAPLPPEDNGPKRRQRNPGEQRNPGDKTGAEAAGTPPQAEAGSRPVSSGIMSLDRDSHKQEAQIQPTEQDVLSRLRETTERFVESYSSWHEGEDNEDAVTQRLHDLRRVLARIEIELAASKTKDSFHRPIPIPMHRSHKQGG